MNPLLHDSNAAIVVAGLLQQYNQTKLTRLVNHLYNRFDNRLRAIFDVSDQSIRKELILMMSEKYINELRGYRQIPDDVASFMENVLKTRTRRALAGDNSKRIDRLREKYGWRAE